MSHLALVRKLEAGQVARSGAGAALDALAARALEGQPEATGELLRAVLPAVRRACRALLGASHSDLEDAVQDALIAIHRALPRYRFECSFLHYAVRITFRTTHGLRRRLLILADRFRLSPTEQEPSDPRAPIAADTAVMAEQSEALRRMISQLPRAQAEALLLHVALEYSIAEAAAVCEVPVNTIKTRLRLGKDSLRRRIQRDPKLSRIYGGKS